MSSLEITGGTPLHGTITAAGNKNAALPMIAAALLTDAPVTLLNVPDIGDVGTMLKLVETMGATVCRDKAGHRVTIQARKLNADELDRELCERIRASILFVAPMLHRCGRSTLFPPGGDVIGRRRLDAHLEGLQAFGVNAEIDRNLVFTAPHGGLSGNQIFLSEASVTATEQVLLAAVLAKGRTVISNAATEPHVQDLVRMLQKMGADISGNGANVLEINGVNELNGVEHRVESDHTEVGSFLALAAATGGEITVTDIRREDYLSTIRAFARLGIELTFSGSSVSVAAAQKRQVETQIGGGFPVIDDGPWPQFPSDLMSVLIVLATQVQGTIVFFEKMYESRLYFVDRLISMGANAIICDPHRVVVNGPAKLHGIRLTSPDIRAGMALLGAALCAEGTSLINNVIQIDRGYEDIAGRLQTLGASIKRIE